MGMTLSEKIIAAHAGLDSVRPGEIVTVDVDLCMANDATMRLNVDLVENQIGASQVFDSEKVILIMDHQVPADSPSTAEVLALAENFARRMGIKHFYAADGICHQILFENHVEPGMLIVGADSHTNSHGVLGAVSCGMGSTDISAVMVTGQTWLQVPESVKFVLNGVLGDGVTSKDVALSMVGRMGSAGLVYRAVEFSGAGLETISLAERFTLCNMTTEMGAKSSMIAPTDEVWDYLEAMRGHAYAPRPELVSDPDAVFEAVHEVDLSALEPQVACPHAVDNVHNVSAVSGERIDQAFLGACTNARIEDLRLGAHYIKGRKVADNVRFLVTPASRRIYRQAMQEGLLEIFMDAGAIVNHPGCSACWGACQGVLAEGQRMISSGNRNFPGRAGAPGSEIFLASPATVAASAVMGEITDPRNFSG